VSDLAGELEMAPQAISNQLQRLADRRRGAAPHYHGGSVVELDPCEWAAQAELVLVAELLIGD
jgi:hypothetical protein